MRARDVLAYIDRVERLEGACEFLGTSLERMFGLMMIGALLWG